MKVESRFYQIHTDQIKKLFAPFSQADASTTRRYGGTGLGLAICARLAGVLGGRIWVESTVNQGTSFHFTIAAREGAETSGQPGLAVRQLAGRHVLVVDDVEEIRDLLALHLARAGMLVRTAASAEEALPLLDQAPPVDAAVIDLYLAGSSGADLARAIRSNPARAQLPLIAVSSIKKSALGTDQGLFNLHLLKPVRAELLLNALERALEGNPGDDVLQSSLKAYVPRPDHTGLRVLVADDNRINQQVAAKMLEQSGIVADIASDGAEVLEVLETREYDIILMDVQMPEVDGLEATRRIIAKYGDARPRIIALTANAMQGDRERCLAAGMDDYLAKPLLGPALQAVLARQTNGRDRLNRSGKRRILAPPGPVAPATEASATVTPALQQTKPPAAQQTTAPSAPDGNQTVLLDHAVLKGLRDVFGGDSSAMHKLFGTFFTDAHTMQTEMAHAHNTGEFGGLGSLAHKLKGVARTVGTAHLGNLANALEICAGQKDAAGSLHYLQQIEVCLPLTQRALYRQLRSDAAAPVNPP